jgi:tritrans,polycis-undecaprenyl-diphosphate synthase [geranylgeranyl-diphosphate specific]
MGRGFFYKRYEKQLVSGVLSRPVPQHIAIIQDGNRRWAKKIREPVSTGHKRGAETTEKLLDWCLDIGIRQLTIYTFSTENFSRSGVEQDLIFDLIERKFREVRESPRTHNNRMRVRAIGEVDLLPQNVVDEIRAAEKATSEYDELFLNVAVAYGGRQELVEVAKRLARDVKSGRLKPEEIDEEDVHRCLYNNGFPKAEVDLIIRTAGMERTSNFLPWQSCGNECAIYVCAPYWPEFRKIDFLRAIRTYQQREQEHRNREFRRIVELAQAGGVRDDQELSRLTQRLLDISAKEAELLLTDH